MRRNRIILLLLWLSAMLAISVSGGQMAYGLFILFSLIPLTALFYLLIVMFSLRIFQHIDEQDLIANHPADFEFILQNDSIIPFVGVKIEFYSDFSFVSDPDLNSEYEIFPGSSIRLNTSIICRYRGRYPLGIRFLLIQDFFRLFSFRYRIREPLLLTVKPDIIRLNDLKTTKPAYVMVTENKAHRQTPDVLSRNYVAGDDPRLINWKVSAALNKLMVREMIGEQQQGVAIIMDSGRYEKEAVSYLPLENKLLEIVIALNLFFSERGISVTTYLEDEELLELYTDSGQSFEKTYALLSEFGFAENRTSAKLCNDLLLKENLVTKAAVFFIVQKWDENYAALAAELERYQRPLVVYKISEKASTEKLPEMQHFFYVDPDQDLRELF